ncbi:MAG: 4Fe-4S ferredoxin [Acidimicrobiales bacterium]
MSGFDVVIVGAGPAAAGAALALVERGDARVTILDVGGRLEPHLDAARRHLASSPPAGWDPDERARLAVVAEPRRDHRLPEKRTFGSDFAFRDFGQRQGLADDVRVVSGALGGFSNVWGAQTMTYSVASFTDWPFTRGELEPHYRAVLKAIPYAGEIDDLAEYFPLLEPADPLPPLAGNVQRVLERYERRRLAVRSAGVLVGRARLAMRASSCVSCGLCMTGCPYGLIYSAAQTIDALADAGRIRYRPGVVALGVGERDDHPHVVVRPREGGPREVVEADVVLLAAGAIGTTRLVAGSLGQWGRPVPMVESAQFVVPLASVRATHAAREEGTFTLNQFNILLPFDEAGHDLVQIHGYPYSRALDTALPGPLRHGPLAPLGEALLRRVTVGLGYLPSWWSPGFEVTVTPGPTGDSLARVSLSPTPGREALARRRLREIALRLTRVGRHLGIWPIVPMMTLSAATRSYHFGGSFAHRHDPRPGIDSDVLGRVAPWKHVHLVDASVFPTVSATTFTLTIMANAHRIASTLEVR